MPPRPARQGQIVSSLRDDGTNRSDSLSESFLAEKPLPFRLTGRVLPARHDQTLAVAEAIE